MNALTITFVFIFTGLFVFYLWSFGHWGTWGRLAKIYSTVYLPNTDKLESCKRESVDLRVSGQWKIGWNSVFILFEKEGCYLITDKVLRPLIPPLLIPWTSIVAFRETKLLGLAKAEIIIKNSEVSLIIPPAYLRVRDELEV